MAGAVRDDATRWFTVWGSFGQHGSAGQRPFPRLPPAHRPCISGHGRGRGALHLAHGHGRGEPCISLTASAAGRHVALVGEPHNPPRRAQQEVGKITPQAPILAESRRSLGR